MLLGKVIFWLCTLLLLGALAYPFVRFFIKKQRGWKDSTALVAAVVGLVFILNSFWSVAAGGKQPLFFGLIGECFLGIDVPALDC